MLERFALALLISLSLGLSYWLIGRLLLARNARRALRLDEYRLGRPAILYFTTPDCAPCRTIQRPALESLVELLGAQLQIIEVNALEQPELADVWGVLSVPTTFLIDAQGRPRGVNHGVARAPKLLAQLQKIAPGLVVDVVDERREHAGKDLTGAQRNLQD